MFLEDRILIAMPFVDTQMLISEDQLNLKCMLTKLKLFEEFKKWGLGINEEKTHHLGGKT